MEYPEVCFPAEKIVNVFHPIEFGLERKYDIFFNF